MNRIKFLLLTIVTSTIIFSCKKDDDSVAAAPPRDRATQYATDLADIEEYLHTHYLTVTIDGNGNPVPKIDSILDGGTQVSIWDQTDYPLLSKTVQNDTRVNVSLDGVGTRIDDPVDYKIYYLKIREGVGQSPTKVDSTFVTYNGHDLDDEQFDNRPNPVWIIMDQLGVTGWRHILPEFKTGNASEDPSNPGNVLFTDYGVMVMFIPSGLGYYNGAPSGSGISAYSPLVFTVNLHALQYRDNDLDGILSKDEDLNGNGDYYDDDTDGDGIPNFIDIDDDDDDVNTIVEISDAFGNPYAFDAIPNCAGTTGGLKKHLDPSCQ